MTSVVYIMGAHRSGATAVGALLATAPSTFYVGELYRFPYPILQAGGENRRCSCGLTAGTCPFWSTVAARARSEPQLLNELRHGQMEFEWWRRAAFGMFHRREHPETVAHADRTLAWIRLIAASAGATHMVESSYSPIRARLYRLIERRGIRVQYLHLVRDGRSFMQSELSMGYDPEAPWLWLRLVPIVIARWMAYNLFSIVLFAHDRHRYLRIRYEDLLRDPDGVLRRVEERFGIDLSSAREHIRANQFIEMRHVIAGNLLRLEGRFRLRASGPPVNQLSRGATLLFWVLAGWLMLALGYHRRSDR